MARWIDRIAHALRRSPSTGEADAERQDDAVPAPPDAASLAQYRQDVYVRFAAPGHYYSPIPNYEDLARDQDRIFSMARRDLPGVRLDAGHFRERIATFAQFNADFPYADGRDAALRFHLDNPTYSRGDAIVLYSMMRLHRPQRIIEIGSGLSTWLMLDVNERFLDNRTRITSVDPHSERMLAGLLEGDRERLEVLAARVQDVAPERFAALSAGDIVFVDSTHVSRCDSDVNHILFTVLPSLAPGVLVHFHDMFWPFEYPKHWLLEIGAAWNEAYLMRAFLQYNETFEIDFFSDYAAQFLRADVERSIPLFLAGPGSSLWLRRGTA